MFVILSHDALGDVGIVLQARSQGSFVIVFKCKSEAFVYILFIAQMFCRTIGYKLVYFSCTFMRPSAGVGVIFTMSYTLYFYHV